MSLPVEIQVALIAAVTSTLITPLVQLGVDSLRRGREHKRNVAPIIEHVRVLHKELLQAPLNPNMEGVTERIEVIEQFHDLVFSSIENHHIKQAFIDNAKHLEARHKQPRQWMQIEYPEECHTFGNAKDRFLAVLNKDKKIPRLFDPSE